MELKLYDSNLATPTLIADLTARHQNLVFSTRLPGGFHLCSFKLRTSLGEAWQWINERMFYRITVADVKQTLWEGRINSIRIIPSKDQGTILEITATGYYANLRDIPYNTAYNAVASVVIKAVLTANCAQISADQTHIDATDITINSAAGSDYLDIYPMDLFEKLLQFSDSTMGIWYFAIWENRIPYLFKKTATSVDWYSSVRDFVDLSLTHRGETLWNSAYAVYTSAGATTARTVSSENTVSQTKYNITRQYVVSDIGVTGSTAAIAQRDMIITNFASIYPRATSMVLGDRVRTDSGVIYSSSWVRAGQVLRITDLVPVTSNLSSVTLDATRTFYLIETEYDVEKHQLRIVPDTDNMRLDAILARRLGV